MARRGGQVGDSAGRRSVISPLVGSDEAEQHPQRVVLPEPLGPRTPTTRPGWTSKSTSSTARIGPKSFVSPVAVMGSTCPARLLQLGRRSRSEADGQRDADPDRRGTPSFAQSSPASVLGSGVVVLLGSNQSAVVAEPGTSRPGSPKTIGSTSRRTIAGAELISARPIANAPSIPKSGAACRSRNRDSEKLQLPPARSRCRSRRGEAVDEITRASATPASSFAATRRSRLGTSVNVESAVRCDHSLVTRRMPTTGEQAA